MYFQILCLAESLATLHADMGLHFAMCVDVIPQMILPPEGLATHRAGEGSLVAVNLLVDGQVVSPSKLFATNMTMMKLAESNLVSPHFLPLWQ